MWFSKKKILNFRRLHLFWQGNSYLFGNQEECWRWTCVYQLKHKYSTTLNEIQSANYKKRIFNSLTGSINDIDHRRLDMPHLVSYIKHCLHIWPEVMPRPIDKVSFQQGNENCSIKYIFGMMLYVNMAKIKKLFNFKQNIESMKIFFCFIGVFLFKSNRHN